LHYNASRKLCAAQSTEMSQKHKKNINQNVNHNEKKLQLHIYLPESEQSSYPLVSRSLGPVVCRALGDRHSGLVEAVERGHHQRPLHGVHGHLLSFQRLQERGESWCHGYRYRQHCDGLKTRGTHTCGFRCGWGDFNVHMSTLSFNLVYSHLPIWPPFS